MPQEPPEAEPRPIRSGRACPVCGQEMTVEHEENICIDVCGEHGIWLDKGELPAIVAAIQRREDRKGRRKQRVRRDRELREARRKGKLQGAFFGFWSLLFD